MIPDRRKQAALALLGLSAGVATGMVLWRRRSAGRGPTTVDRWARPRGSAQEVAQSLRSDAKLARRGIEVDTISEGVVELTGSVRDRAEAERAVGIAQSTTGVYTVVNRLRIEDEETYRERTRRRWTEGAPELRERHHYGMGVGMGTRRQAPSTDPDRPSDKQRLLERELEVANVDHEDDAPSPDMDAESRVEGSPMKPGDERAIEEAGLSPDGGGAVRPGEDEGEDAAASEPDEERT